jgi:(6-4)DNA photolyase
VKNVGGVKTKNMAAVNILFPHQLFEKSPIAENGYPVYLIEEFLFFKQYSFHKQKIAFHRASMKSYAQFLSAKGITVDYISSTNPTSDIRRLIVEFATRKIDTIYYIDPTDNWLEKRIRSSAAKANMKLVQHENPLFLNNRKALSTFFKSGKKKFFQTSFYKEQRKARNILIDQDENPVGGQWTFDADNRKKYPKKKTAPPINYPESNEHYQEAIDYVNKYFPDNPGKLSNQPLYPFDFKSSAKWLTDFLQTRFEEFGPYEDAIVRQETILHHSVLTPMLNVGLISPQKVIATIISYAEENNIPINSTEGFVRQMIGWREFIRGIYECKGSEERTRNYWNFRRKIPKSFYTGTTGITPVDDTIKKVLKTGYCHHIERLMILGNFMLLCEFDPDEVYRWFMELFIDAYDWVMVPNVYGMSQFADGGLMATKPYISGSNYIMKMSDYKKGDWQVTWDALFWHFMEKHRDFFLKNPRLSMLVRNLDKMDKEKKTSLMNTANNYLKVL